MGVVVIRQAGAVVPAERIISVRSGQSRAGSGDAVGVWAGGLDVKIAGELLERARAEGVSLVDQRGLLQQVTRAVLQAALEAEMADHHRRDLPRRPRLSTPPRSSARS